MRLAVAAVAVVSGHLGRPDRLGALDSCSRPHPRPRCGAGDGAPRWQPVRSIASDLRLIDNPNIARLRIRTSQ